MDAEEYAAALAQIAAALDQASTTLTQCQAVLRLWLTFAERYLTPEAGWSPDVPPAVETDAGQLYRALIRQTRQLTREEAGCAGASDEPLPLGKG